MIKSITNTKSKIWIGVDLVLFGISLFLFLIKFQQPLLFFLIAISILYRIKWRSDIVTISATEIQISNWFTSNKTILELGSIECYAFNAELMMGHRLLLISDNLVVAKTRHRNYSNLNELLDYLDNSLKIGSCRLKSR